MMKKLIRRKKDDFSVGFTLVELLVVVAIIGILAAIILPSLQRAKELASRATCSANLKDIGLAMHMYTGDNREWFPYPRSNLFNDARTRAGATLAQLYPDYTRDWNIFICPSDPISRAVPVDPAKHNIGAGNDYLVTEEMERCFATNRCPSGSANTVPHLSYAVQCAQSSATARGISQRVTTQTGGKSIAMMMDRANGVSIPSRNIDDFLRSQGGFYWLDFDDNPDGNQGPRRMWYSNHGKTEGSNVWFIDGAVKWINHVQLPSIVDHGDLRYYHWGFKVREVPTYGEYRFVYSIPANAFDYFYSPF